MNLVRKQKIYHLEEVKVSSIEEQLVLYKKNNWREDYLNSQFHKIKIVDNSNKMNEGQLTLKCK